MNPKFEVIFLEQAIDFMAKIDPKPKAKIYYNIDKARLLAFWDKTDKTETLVLATHGIIKKTDKVPKADIEKAKKIMAEYFAQKE